MTIYDSIIYSIIKQGGKFSMEDEEKYLDTLKKEDSYHFSIDFEYIEKNYGDDQYDIATATMEVDIIWDSDVHGYRVSYYCPDEGLIDQNEGNGDIDDFYEHHIELEVLDRLKSMGIYADAMYAGTGRD